MSRDLWRALLAVLGLIVLPTLSACETAPATGRTIFTGGLSAEDEVQLGYQEHQKIVPQFGGVYEDAALSVYISSIGNLLARTSETPNLQFTFTVLDTPIVNAFALPGGYVYVTRGLLALAQNEAEVAGVLAHEIGHVTARHSAERYGQTVAASVFGAGLGVLLGSGAASDLYGTVAGLALRSYSREQEHEADLLGVRYLTRAGYDPNAMASFLVRLQAHSRLEAELRGEPGKADDFSIMQTHPRTVDRVQRTIAEARTKAVVQPMTARDIYLGKIDGMLYGDNPKQGLIRGRSFRHPDLRFSFTVPQGFRLFNSPQRVIARGPDGAAILFDRAETPSSVPISAYLTEEWATGVTLQQLERININGMEAATGVTQAKTRGGRVDLRLLAIRYDQRTIYRMIFLTPPQLTGALSRPMRETTYSFRKLSAVEAARLKPLRIDIHDVRRGETAGQIAQRMPFGDFRLERFLVLNGLTQNQAWPEGDKVKTVVE